MFFGNESMNCRIVVIGDTLVGKTSLMNRLVLNKFDETEPPTVGATHQMVLKDVSGYRMNIQIWDTAGQEKFRALGPIYFRDSHGAIIVYDQTKSKTFEDLEEWISSYIKIVGENANIAIAANKNDIEDRIEVDFNSASSWAATNNYLIEKTSAKTGEGIDSLLFKLSSRIVSSIEKTKPRENNINISDTKTPSQCSC